MCLSFSSDGVAGPQGETGVAWPQGETGVAGPQGETGVAGPHVSLFQYKHV